MNLQALETPALVLDAVKFERNVARMLAHIGKLGVAFRPHVKTSKSFEVARCMISTPEGPITVSTLKEAEQFFAHGIREILYAVSITPNKLDHVLRLRAMGARLTVILDNAEAAHAIAAKTQATGHTFDVLIEIDCDGHRAGIKPESTDLITVAHILHEGGVRLRGVMTHAGGSYSCTDINAIRTMAEQERRLAVRSAHRLIEAGFPCPVVSVGSTPTATFAENLEGVTEVRAGVFAFFDLVMAGLGVCQIDDIALSVLTTVIGHRADCGWILVDAGWMAMSRDRGTAKQSIDQGYGLVCNLDGTPLDGVIMVEANQEHGVIAHRSGDPALIPHLPVGTLLRILPNHACATGAQHQCYHVVRSRSAVNEVWPRFSGW
ncbi:MAG: DSD1 family PLP-dependent enzyme [Betaproteobacteria bacterium]|nr:DSD1 family PLP-dependent enzyme [Betaproteobacteria bacterium]